MLVDSGFSQALIRKQDCTDRDYSTVLWLNVSISLILYALVFLFAPLIATYFEEPRLVLILRLMTLVLPLNAMNVIQRTILSKAMNFKKQAIVSLISVTLGMACAIIMAAMGYGVWSLVAKALVTQSAIEICLWFSTSWRPNWDFSFSSCKELFSFGSKLLLVYGMSSLFRNIYNVVIGKEYQATQLGYYTNADLMSSMPMSLLTIVFNRVVFPALTPLQDNNEELRRVVRSILRPMQLLAFLMMFFFAASAESLVILFLGEQWSAVVPYFQILCLGYAASLLHTANQVIMNVKGRSDYFLRTEVAKYILMIPVIVIGIYWDIYALIIGYAIHFWIGFLLNGYYSYRLIGYGIKAQWKDCFPLLIYALVVAGAAYGVSFAVITWHPILKLLVQGAVALIVALLVGEKSSISAYVELRGLFVKQYQMLFQRGN